MLAAIATIAIAKTTMSTAYVDVAGANVLLCDRRVTGAGTVDIDSGGGSGGGSGPADVDGVVVSADVDGVGVLGHIRMPNAVI